MKRRLFLMGLGGLAGCSRDERPRLNIFNWSSYVAPDTIPGFEREFGVRVRYAVYESNEEMLAKVMSGNSGWDVVFPTNYHIGPMRKQGLLARLNHAALRNLDALDRRFRSPSWDPTLEWCVPYMWGGTGIVYNRRLAERPSSWAGLWSESLRGRLTMLDDAMEVLGACLAKSGEPVNCTDPSKLRRAQREALAQKPLLRAYLNAEARDQLVAGDILAAQSWATTALQAMDGSADLEFVYPSERFPLYADNAVILRESRRAPLAHAFINYLLRPLVAASIVRAVKTATANARAYELLEPGLQANRTLYPSEADLVRGEWWETPPPAIQRLRDRLWTEIKAA